MKILYLNAGNETGGGMYHILRILQKMRNTVTCILGVMEKAELYERAKASNITTVYFENDTRLSAPLLKKIARFMKDEGITHVHTHGPRANVYMNIIRRLVHVHWIVTVHSDPFFDFKDKGIYGTFLTRLHIRAIKHADQIISVSDTFHLPLLNAGLQKKRLLTIHNGIDFQEEFSDEWSVGRLPLQSTRERFNFSEADFLFVKVARLENVKGHHIALQAFAQLVEEKKDVHLLLVGDGRLRTSLESFVKTLQIENQVHFLGERKDVHLFYEMADVTLLTSLSESFPYVLLESARAKTPVIATDVGDINRLLYKDKLGWKVAAGDIDCCLFAMEEAVRLREAGMLRNLGENLHSHASTHFSLDKCVNEVYNVYRSM